MATDLAPVFELLDAYIQEFEPAIARDQLPEVVKTILPLVEGQALNPETTSALVNQVVSLFDPQLAQAKPLTDTAKATAQTVAQTLTQLRSGQLAELVGQGLQQQLGNVVSQADLPDVINQLLPKVASLHLNQADVPQLANQVISMVSPDLTAQITNLTQAVTTGKNLVANVLENFGSQQVVVDVLKSCAKNVVGGIIADANLPDVIKTIIAATDIKFNTESGSAFIEQISFTYKSGGSGAFVMPSAQQIAQRLDGEIQAFLAQRSETLHATDVTQAVVHEAPANASSLGGLHSIEVSSTIQPS